MNESTRAEAHRASDRQGLLHLVIQYAKFGGVGVAALLVHVALYTLLIELFGIWPLLANLIAFCVAVVVSYLGHFNWTFSSQARDLSPTPAQKRAAFVRFSAVALLGLGLNSLGVFLIVDVAGLSYLYTIAIMLLVVPPILFIINKVWAFRLA